MTARSTCATCIPAVLAATLVSLMPMPQLVADESFRVETDVFVEKEPDPVGQTLTLFADNAVYDFMLTAAREVTIFDPHRGRVILLDPERKVRAEVRTSELIEFTAGIRTRSSRNGNDSPFGTEFAGHYDEEAAVVLLEGHNLVYRAVGLQPKFTDATGRYREFADCYAQLNAARPGNPAPFGRLELNRRLKELAMVPTEIDRTLSLPGRFGQPKKQVTTSRHAFTWQLSSTDRKRIQDAQTFSATYRPIGLKEYWGLTEDVKN